MSKTPAKKKRVIRKRRMAYDYAERDPVFEVVQAMVIASEKSFKELDEEGGATAGTIRRYMGGTSKTGRFDCLMATIRSAGGDLVGILPSGKQVKIGGKK